MTDIGDLVPLDDEMGFTSPPVASILGGDVVAVEPTLSLLAASEKMHAAGYGILVVGTRERVEGVVSERDILRAVATGTDLAATTVGDIESTHLRWAATASTVRDVAEEMMEDYIRHVLVRNDDGTLAGIVSMRDVLGAVM
ncbi:MAG: CBS domain-containing protein [Actinomycetota bacterium]